MFRLYANGTMTILGQPATTSLRQVAWKPDGSYALISGDSAVLLKYDGIQLIPIPPGIATRFNFWTVSLKPYGSHPLLGGPSPPLLNYLRSNVPTLTTPTT